MNNLSPTAQAVIDAYYSTDSLRAAPAIGSALRAAANQVISSVSPPCEDFNEYDQGFLAAHIKYRDKFLAIADELDDVKYGTYRSDLSDKPK